MTNTHTPLGDLDANSQIASPIDTIPDDKTKPAPSFQAESQQHRNLHNKLLRQEQYVRQDSRVLNHELKGCIQDRQTRWCIHFAIR
jgi:hypothetical protein